MTRNNDPDDPAYRQSHRRRAQGGQAQRSQAQGGQAQGGQAKGNGRRRLTRKARIAGWLVVLVTALVTGSSLAAYAEYLSTVHSIETFSTASISGDQPPAYNSSENILVVGSQSRAGSNERFGASVQGQSSDTMVVLHITPGHEGAVVIGLPLDTEVPILACGPDGLGDPGQPAQPGQTEMLNATFAYGGPPCLWKTVEEQTGIRIDHYIGLTFTGFEQVINDIGGVNVCLPTAIHGPPSGIDLSAGLHHVTGAQAVAVWRGSYAGEGSGPQGMQRQQGLVAGLIQEIKSGGLLSNYSELFKTLRDTAKALTVDQGLSVDALVSLAEDLRTLSGQSVQFVTVPAVPDPAGTGRVLWQQPEAGQLFHAIAHDAAIPRSVTSPPSTASPGDVQVDVENGNGITGVAAQAASALTRRGFKVTKTGNAANFDYVSNVIEYASPADMGEVNTLRAQFSSGSVQLQEDPKLAPGTVYLILGSDFNGLATAPKRPSSSGGRNPGKASGGINATADVCNGQNAVAGADNQADGT
jgi:LCP family protein required for cell wall assembly